MQRLEEDNWVSFVLMPFVMEGLLNFANYWGFGVGGG
jgi:hypothetical protein